METTPAVLPLAKTITKVAVAGLQIKVQDLKDARDAILRNIDAVAHEHGHFPDGMTSAQTDAWDALDTAISVVESKLRLLRGAAT